MGQLVGLGHTVDPDRTGVGSVGAGSGTLEAAALWNRLGDVGVSVDVGLERSCVETKKGEADPEEPTPPRTGGRLISRCDCRAGLRPSHT